MCVYVIVKIEWTIWMGEEGEGDDGVTQSQSPRSLFNGTWQKRPIDLE